MSTKSKSYANLPKGKSGLVVLTNTTEMSLHRIPRSRWAEIKALYQADRFTQLTILWNKYNVGTKKLCDGCLEGLSTLHKHISILVARYEQEVDKGIFQVREYDKEGNLIVKEEEEAPKSTSRSTNKNNKKDPKDGDNKANEGNETTA